MDVQLICALVRRLHPIKLAGVNGPYSVQEVADAESFFGVPIVGTLRLLLTSVGGNMGFDTGVVGVRGLGDLTVRTLFGLGRDDRDMRDRATGYAGQVPQGWIPFADDERGYFYCLAPSGAIYHVELAEQYWTRPRCPEVPPPGSRIVAKSLDEFLTLLELPVWARPN